jgi:hypothetical protein
MMCDDPAFERRASRLAERLTIVSSCSSSSCSMSNGSRIFGKEITAVCTGHANTTARGIIPRPRGKCS